MNTYEKHIDDIPYAGTDVPVGETFFVPGFGTVKKRKGTNVKTKFLGVDDEVGPWFYLLEHKAGSKVALHKHHSNRIEYILEGEIEFKELNKESHRYGTNSFTYVKAGTMYEYEVLKDTKILLFFESRPGFSNKLKDSQE